jgi:hypothetical protein
MFSDTSGSTWSASAAVVSSDAPTSTSSLGASLLLLDEAWAELDASPEANVDGSLSDDAADDVGADGELALAAAIFNDESNWWDVI